MSQVVTLLRSGDAKLVELTDTAGRPACLSVAAIAAIRKPKSDEPASAKAVVIVGGHTQAARQTIDQIQRALAGDPKPQSTRRGPAS